jgi:hypothetical protein
MYAPYTHCGKGESMDKKTTFLDKSGSYDGRSDPASGSPMGLYGKAMDKAEPIAIAAGSAVEVVLSFDDSRKTP